MCQNEVEVAHKVQCLPEGPKLKAETRDSSPDVGCPNCWAMLPAALIICSWQMRTFSIQNCFCAASHAKHQNSVSNVKGLDLTAYQSTSPAL